MEDLDRFVRAQADHYDTALAELRAGHKRSHWMWYVFPQIAGLGHSATAQHYAIRDLAEARAYLTHPLLGPRYLACVNAVLAHRDIAADRMIGSWAGAMGHTQWMPEVWLNVGFDFDGDGRVSPFGSPADALASTARYLVRRRGAARPARGVA